MSDFDAAKKRLEEMDRANLFLNHGRAKHADACWRCDEPWPCLTMRVVIDADHEWAHWHDKWIAALDLMGSQSERAEKAEAELARRPHAESLATAVKRIEELEDAGIAENHAILKLTDVPREGYTLQEEIRAQLEEAQVELAAERERAKRLEQALAGWLATESLPDCRACAVLDAGPDAEILAEVQK